MYISLPKKIANWNVDNYEIGWKKRAISWVWFSAGCSDLWIKAIVNLYNDKDHYTALFPVDFVKFTEAILNGKLHFFVQVISFIVFVFK